MNLLAPAEKLQLPLARFRRYRETGSLGAYRSSRLMFPDLRGFEFLKSKETWLESNYARIHGARVGVVSSSGHRIALNDELHHTLLLPTNGMIGVEHRSKEYVAQAGELLSVSIGERKTMVGENYLGIVIQLPLTMLREKAATYDPENKRLLSYGTIKASAKQGIGSSLWHQAMWLTNELDRSDVLLRSDKLGASAINFLVDLVSEHLAELANAEAGFPEPPTASQRLVRQAEEFMRANLAEPMTITDMAADLGVTARSLQASFKKLRNISPGSFLTARRLERARALLLAPRPGDSVTTIIYDCGVSNTGRFAGLYRSVYGESPSSTLATARDHRRRTLRE